MKRRNPSVPFITIYQKFSTDSRQKIRQFIKCDTTVIQHKNFVLQQPLRPQAQQLLPRNMAKGMESKSKNKLHQDQKLLHGKGNSQQNKKTTDRMREDI